MLVFALTASIATAQAPEAIFETARTDADIPPPDEDEGIFPLGFVNLKQDRLIDTSRTEIEVRFNLSAASEFDERIFAGFDVGPPDVDARLTREGSGDRYSWAGYFTGGVLGTTVIGVSSLRITILLTLYSLDPERPAMRIIARRPAGIP